jgi:hypothetical protein
MEAGETGSGAPEHSGLVWQSERNFSSLDGFRARSTAPPSVYRHRAARPSSARSERPVLVLGTSEQGVAMALGDEVDAIFRREVKSLPAYAKAQAAGGSGVAPPVDEMNQLLMGLAIAAQGALHLLGDRIEDMEKRMSKPPG